MKKEGYGNKDLIAPLVLILLFWIPLVNIIAILPIAVFLSVKAVRKTEKPRKRAIALAVWGLITFIVGLVIFIITSTSLTFSIVWGSSSVASMVFALIRGFSLKKLK